MADDRAPDAFANWLQLTTQGGDQVVIPPSAVAHYAFRADGTTELGVYGGAAPLEVREGRDEISEQFVEIKQRETSGVGQLGGSARTVGTAVASTAIDPAALARAAGMGGRGHANGAPTSVAASSAPAVAHDTSPAEPQADQRVVSTAVGRQNQVRRVRPAATPADKPRSHGRSRQAPTGGARQSVGSRTGQLAPPPKPKPSREVQRARRAAADAKVAQERAAHKAQASDARWQTFDRQVGALAHGLGKGVARGIAEWAIAKQTFERIKGYPANKAADLRVRSATHLIERDQRAEARRLEATIKTRYVEAEGHFQWGTNGGKVPLSHMAEVEQQAAARFGLGQNRSIADLRDGLAALDSMIDRATIRRAAVTGHGRSAAPVRGPAPFDQDKPSGPTAGSNGRGPAQGSVVTGIGASVIAPARPSEKTVH